MFKCIGTVCNILLLRGSAGYMHILFARGFAETCRDYAWNMGEVYRPLRLHNYLLSYVIDDAGTRGRAVLIIKTLVLLLTALSFYLSWDKCQFTCVQRGKFLSLTVESAGCLSVQTERPTSGT